MSGQTQSGNGSSGEGQSQSGSRTITIVTTRGQKKKIEFEGTTWEGLKKEVERAGYDLSNMKAVEGVRRNSLEHPQALIPEGDFNLFLMPYQSKSGNERSEMYTLIKKYKDKFDDAKDFFGDYTHTPSNKLKSQLKKFERTHEKEEKDKKDKEEKDRLKKEEDERIKKEREEDEKLQNEMAELMSDMPEVKRRRR